MTNPPPSFTFTITQAGERLEAYSEELLEAHGDAAFNELICDNPLRYMVMARRLLMSELGLSKEDANNEAVMHQGLLEIMAASPTVQSASGRQSLVIIGRPNPDTIIRPGYVPKRDRQQG